MRVKRSFLISPWTFGSLKAKRMEFLPRTSSSWGRLTEVFGCYLHFYGSLSWIPAVGFVFFHFFLWVDRLHLQLCRNYLSDLPLFLWIIKKQTNKQIHFEIIQPKKHSNSYFLGMLHWLYYTILVFLKKHPIILGHWPTALVILG